MSFSPTVLNELMDSDYETGIIISQGCAGTGWTRTVSEGVLNLGH